MESVSSSEVGAQLPQLLERVANGEEISISEHGKSVARLMPALLPRPRPDVRAAVATMKAFRKGRTLGGLSVREMIEEGRRS